VDDVFNNPGFYVSYAVIQAIVVLLLIRLIDYYDRQPLGLLAAMAFWGATGAALIALAGNRAVRAMLGPDARDVFGNAIAPPLVEEAAKGLALLAAVGPIRWIGRRFGLLIFEGVTAGMVYGAAVGLGFAFTEDIFYFVNEAQSQGLQSGLDVFVHRRDFFGPAMLHHPLWTAAFGAGLGAAAWTTSRPLKVLFPLLGFTVAVLMHAVNNGLVEFVLWLRYGMEQTAAWARGEVLDPAIAETADTLVTLTNLLDFYILAMFVLAVVLWLRYQRRIINEELADEMEVPEANWALLRSGQFERWSHRRRLHRELIHLALLKWRSKRFGGDHERIQRLRREIATLATYEVGAGNLPDPATPLLGRSHEIEALQELFGRSEVRLVTLTGPGGTGKTRLAIEVARSLRDHYPSGAFFVSLAPVRDPALVPAAVAEVLGVQLGEGGAIEPLKDFLRDKQLLLVLDNLEQVADSGPALAELIAAAPRLRVLATSRTVLGVPTEHEFPVGSLREQTAVELFAERAQAVDRDFRVTEENEQELQEICRRLDGLPLAIELTAARVRLLSPAELLARLEQPAEASPLQETISWSYELLEPDDRALLSRLGVFVGGSTLRAAEFVCGDGVVDVLAGLESLIEKSLARRTRGTSGDARVEMLETIRVFAAERLVESGEDERMRRRLAEHCVALAERAEPQLTGPEQSYWLDRLSEENPNIREALAWSAEAGELETGLRIAGALVRFWSARGLMAEGRRWLDPALEADGDVAPAIRAKALFAAGYTALGLADFAEARRRFEASLALASELDDRRLHGASLAQLAWVAMADGRSDEARALADASLHLARPAGDWVAASGALNVLGELAWRDGNGQAAALYEEGLALRRELGDDRLVANSLLLLGRVEQSEERFEEALELARRLGDTWSISVALVNLGRARRQREPLEEALQLARDRGDKRLGAEALQALATVELRDGNAARAARLRGAAQALLDEVGAELSPPELELDAELLPGLEEALGKDGVDREWAAGREEGTAAPVA
jgi:predicted ATPase/RsiW-degrading membrane proteinase PrsW (M82 family)